MEREAVVLLSQQQHLVAVKRAVVSPLFSGNMVFQCAHPVAAGLVSLLCLSTDKTIGCQSRGLSIDTREKTPSKH